MPVGECEWVEVELIGFVMVLMEEDDGLGSQVVDANHSGCLFVERSTCRRGVWWVWIRVSRWNLRCWLTLLYLDEWLRPPIPELPAEYLKIIRSIK